MALNDWISKSEKPATHATTATHQPAQTKKSRPSVATEATVAAAAETRGWGYTVADLQEMDRLLRQLAELEGWTKEELEGMLDERRRMAPARVPLALRQLAEANKAAMAPWPNPPEKRAKVELCVLTGGKK